jgi:hypothetical protein
VIGVFRSVRREIADFARGAMIGSMLICVPD